MVRVDMVGVTGCDRVVVAVMSVGVDGWCSCGDIIGDHVDDG